MSTTKQQSSKDSLNNVLAKATKKVTDVKQSTNDYKPVGKPFSNYEINSADVVRNKKTGKIQQIPKGKKCYYIPNDAGDRRSISLADLKLLMPQKPAVKKAKAVKEVKVKSELSKDQIDALLNKPFVKKILAEGGKKHLLCYKLHLEDLKVDEIMAVTNTPYNAVKRNIWLYTSGQKTL